MRMRHDYASGVTSRGLHPGNAGGPSPLQGGRPQRRFRPDQPETPHEIGLFGVLGGIRVELGLAAL